MLTLFDVQSKHVLSLQESLKKVGCALDSSETGCGKTLCAIETVKGLGLTPIVVCPKAVVSAWETTFEGQKCSHGGIFTWEKLRGGRIGHVVKRRGKKGFLWTVSQRDTVLIFDEVHKAKGVRTLNSNLLSSARAQNIRTLLLSATAAEDPREMRSIGYALDLHTLSNFWDWAKAWGCKFDTWGSLQFPDSEAHRLKDLHKLIYPSRGSRLTREDLGTHFSECKVMTTPINFSQTSKIRTLVKELNDELEKIEEHRELDGDEPIAITKLLRLRQEIEILKVPDIVTLIESHRSEGNSVAVFLNFTDSINAVSRRLTEPHGFVMGGQSKTERDDYIASFQANSSRVILCNTSAGGVGVSLHDKLGGHPRVALISPTYNAKEFKQILGRVDRVGNLTPSLQQILVAADTIEKDIIERMMVKLNNLDLLHTESDVSNTTMKTEEVIKVEGGVEDHAEFGPSSLKLVKICAGYKSKSGTNPAAEMGTRVHLALETGDWSALSDWESSLAEYTQRVEDLIFTNLGFDDFKDYKEIRLIIKLLGEETFGTCDRFSIQGTEAIQIDYKTGRHAVEEPAVNLQAKAYALGAFQKFPEIDTIHFYLICCQRDEILSHTFSRDDMQDILVEISAVIATGKKFRHNFEAATIEDLNPTPYTCEYCAHAGHCPALASMLAGVAKRFHGGGEVLNIPEIVSGACVSDPEIMSQLLILAPIAEEAIKEWKAKAREMIFEEGIEIPGFEVKTRKGRRAITCPKAAWGILRESISPDEEGAALEGFFEGIKSYPITGYEKLVASFAKTGKKKALVAEVVSELESEDFISHGDDVNYISRIKN